jgi:tetratricopeptide (TPR) repeat protein/tRNA A-37 threonylcarbamoyl transferase component Bud32
LFEKERMIGKFAPDTSEADSPAPAPGPSNCPGCAAIGRVTPLGPRLGRCVSCGLLVALPRPARAASARATLAPTTTLAPGTILRDRYRLVEVLGTGAHGITFLAQHEFLNYPCVVKVLPSKVDSSSDGAVRRLRNEASAGFRVSHPNVVRVLDGDACAGTWYFVMEYVDGIDLALLAQTARPIDWRQAVRLATDAARGLDAIHRAGLVHRDIKPSNLILGTDGRVRVADLGVVRLVQAHPELAESADGERPGTLGYAAPEILAGDDDVGCAADLYSLGATLYELLTGSLPRGQSVYRTLLAGAHDPVSWPPAAAGVPKWLQDAVLRLLETAPDRRFASAAALVDFLERPAGPAAVAAPAPGRPTRPEPRGLVVLPFENAAGGADEWLGHAIADHLARMLAREAYVVNLDQFLQTLERVRQRGPRPGATQLLEAGRLSGAALVIEGTFGRSGEQIQLAARAYRSGTAAGVPISPVQGALTTLAELETELYRKLTSALGLSAAEGTAQPRPSAGAVPAAQERFFSAKRAFLRGDYETAMRQGREAVALDPNFGEAVGFVGVCCARTGQYELAIEYNQQQQRLAGEQGDERLMVEAHANLGSMHYFRGEYDAAKECLTRAAQAAEALGLTTDLASIRNNLGFVLLQLGRQAEAEQTYLRAIETHKQYGALVSLIGPYNGMGHVLCEQQRYDEAANYFRRALALAQESDDEVNMGVAYMNLGHAALLQGRFADARHDLAAALNILELTSFWNGLARVYEYMADLNLKLRDCAEAIRCAEKRIGLAQRHANRRMESAAWRQKAEALRLAGRTAEASDCLARLREQERR